MKTSTKWGNNFSDVCGKTDKIVKNVDNRRVQLTKKMLKDALVKLLCTKPMNKISITEICETADVNRTTFYKHYSDEHSLFLEIEKDYYDMINYEMKYSSTTLLAMLNFFKNNSVFSRVLFANNKSQGLAQKIFSIPQIQKAIVDRINIDFPHEKMQKLLYFIFSGSYALVVEWIRSDFIMPTEELEAMLNEFIRFYSR